MLHRRCQADAVLLRHHAHDHYLFGGRRRSESSAAVNAALATSHSAPRWSAAPIRQHRRRPWASAPAARSAPASAQRLAAALPAGLLGCFILRRCLSARLCLQCREVELRQRVQNRRDSLCADQPVAQVGNLSNLLRQRIADDPRILASTSGSCQRYRRSARRPSNSAAFLSPTPGIGL